MSRTKAIYFYILLRSEERKSNKVGLRLVHVEDESEIYLQYVHYPGNIIDEECLYFSESEVKAATVEYLDKFMYAILEELNFPQTLKVIDFKCPFKIEVTEANTLWYEQADYLPWEYLNRLIRTTVLGIMEIKYNETL